MATDGDAPLAGVRVLALGKDVAVRVAGWWLGASGADVATLATVDDRPAPAGAHDPEAARFDRQVDAVQRPADLHGDAPYDVILGDPGSLRALRPALPQRLVAAADTVEVRSPLPPEHDFDAQLRSDMVLWARSGLGYLTRELDESWQPGTPCLPRNRQAGLLAGVGVATAAASLVLERDAGRRPPRHVALDRLELLALLPMQPIAFAQLDGRIVARDAEPAYPGGTMPTRDGLVYVRPVEPSHWAALFAIANGPSWAATEAGASPRLLLEARDELDAHLRAWAAARTTDEIVEACQAAHVPVAPVLRPADVVRDRHLRARGFLVADESGRGARLRLPWLARSDATPSAGPPRVAPRESGVRPVSSGLPLAGLRVLDLTWAWAGPFATTMLADLGAEVVNVEWHPRASNLRRNPPYAHGRESSHDTAGWWSANQRGKLSIGVNMKHPEGRDVIRALAARSDVVVENFSPGVVSRLGVAYDDLRAENPRLVYVSLSAFGQTGPRSHFVGYGTQLHAASGAAFAATARGGAPSQMWIPYPDPVSGLAGAFAIAAGVRGARRTGRSAWIDLSELESLCCVLVEPLLAAQDGAQDGALAATDYVVVATTDERFVALIARRAAEWAAFRDALGASAATPAAVRDAAQLLDASTVLRRSQAAGLIAAALQDSADCLRDPWLVDHGFWVRDRSPGVAETGARIGGAPWHVDGERAPAWRGAPPLFSDTRVVLERIAGYAPDRIDALVAAGAVAVAPGDA